MRFSQRQLLRNSAVLLGSGLVDFLRTPIWRWRTLPELRTKVAAGAQDPPPVTFVEVGREARPNTRNRWGGVPHQNYIIEAKGRGIAFLDYDQDVWFSIYLTKWTRLWATGG